MKNIRKTKRKETWMRWKVVVILFGTALVVATLLAAFVKSTPEAEETVRPYNEGQFGI